MPRPPLRPEGQRFDYIVVGAGAAGAAAAARLATAGADVLLVEAGADPSLISRIPSAAMSLLGSELDWQYQTVPNNVSCLSSRGQQCRFSRGKCLGGSTSINYMLYTRGNRRDFHDIPVPGWTWDNLKPYFLKSEGLQDLDLLPPTSKPYHNTSGTMRIGFFEASQNPWHARLMRSYISLGLPENYDVNADSQIGVSQLIGYVYDGERMSTARGYLAREDVKRSLKIAKNALCTGVIIDRRNVARGVTLVQDLLKLKVYARKEVILSAGAIGTPQILMLSGVGPAEHLHSIDIPVKVDLPGVGANMSDHVLPLILALVDKSEGIQDDGKRLVTWADQLAQLLVARSGPLTSNGLTDVSVFINSHCYDFKRRKLLNESFDGSDCELPNLQIIHAYIERKLLPATKPLFQRITGFNDDVVEQITHANKNHAIIVISPVLLNPHSVGYVRLASADPGVSPAIFPNYLSDERDVDDILLSIRVVEQLMETPLFRKRNATLLHLELPGCPSVYDDWSGYWRCYTRHVTCAVFHSAGTCSLGGVVDARLRVRGVRRLRAADLSVLLRVPRASTAAAAIAVGERVADLALQDN
uniref:Glucose-methanol-choline oxidoreductase N-terminal domain-containing protein n=1 Tax=Heliothis virescens TaxID=7102 RepID=A0A2A4IZN2_HELVI